MMQRLGSLGSMSHRLRLAIASALAAAIMLSVLFAATAVIARTYAIGEKRSALAAALHAAKVAEEPGVNLVEFSETYPEISASLYRGGTLVGRVGYEIPLQPEGYASLGEMILLSSPVKGQTLVLGVDLRETESGLRRLELALGAMILPLALLAGLMTWVAAQAVFRPLQRLTDQALAVSGKNLSERLSTADRAEFGQFAQGLNGMLDRIEDTVRRGERFSADAAHEFRTPLAILRTRLETALLKPRSPEAYQQTLRRAVAEIERVTSIAEALLRSSQGDSAPAGPLDLAPEIAEAVERWQERYTERGVRLIADAEPARAAILRDEVRILTDNLLDNALRFAPDGSTVIIRLRGLPEAALDVLDEGPGIPPELGERVFERLVRGDDSRNRASGGAGIGLAVCRQIALTRGGRAVLGAPPGACVGIRLPAVS